MKVIRTQAEEVISLHGLVLNGSQVSHLEINKLLKHLKMFLIWRPIFENKIQQSTAMKLHFF